MTKSSVSVVIPCYNVADTIARALDSVFAQTLPVMEIICVDDASADQTFRVIKEYAACHSDLIVRVLRNEINRGPSVARNRGWDAAVGEYIAFLDADDMWHPQKIALQLMWMNEHPRIDVCGHAHLIAQPSDNPTLPLATAPRAYTISPDEILISNPFVTPSVMLKREIAVRFNPQRHFTEDYLLWMQLCLDGYRVALLDLPLVTVSRGGSFNRLSQNYFRMRAGDLQNYWQLWRTGKIGLFKLLWLIPFSLLKFLLLLVFPSVHSAIKRRLFQQPLPEND